MTRVTSHHPDALPDLEALSGLAPQLASTFVSVAADIALVLDAQGVIQHVSMGAEPLLGGSGQWLGKRWADTVTGDTRRKIELLLSEVQSTGVTRRRQVNHPALPPAGTPGAASGETSNAAAISANANAAGVEPGLVGAVTAGAVASGDAHLSDDIPVAYSAIRLGPDGPVLAVGRDLRVVAAIQQRFVEASQTMERDYWAQRQAEQQIRTLYQVATDAVLLVDAHTLRVLDANRAAIALLAPWVHGTSNTPHHSPIKPEGQAEASGANHRAGIDALIGTDVAAVVLNVERPGFTQLLATARASGRPTAMQAHAAPAGLVSAPTALVPVEVSATPLRAGADMRLLVNLRRIETERDPVEAARRRSAMVDGNPDALAVTDSSGRVLMCNPAFDRLCNVHHGATACRQTLAELLGDPALTLAHTLQQARQQGLAHAEQVFVGLPTPLQTRGRGVDGLARTQAVELSAQLLSEGDQACLGLWLRAAPEQRGATPPADAVSEAVEQLSRTISQLADQMGLVALPQLLQQANVLAEVHLLKTALRRCDGHAARAAALLGLSLQALQTRLQDLGVQPTAGSDKPTDESADAAPKNEPRN